MVVVGIAGLSGSGKTLLASHVAELSAGTGVLCTDSYYRDIGGLPLAERDAVNFDAPEALDWDLLLSHLQRLRAGRGIDVPKYGFATHERLASDRRLEPVPLLVLEGLFALAEPRVRAMLDLAVFVDAGEEVCLARRIARDTAGRGRTKESVLRQWRRTWCRCSAGTFCQAGRTRTWLSAVKGRPPSLPARSWTDSPPAGTPLASLLGTLRVMIRLAEARMRYGARVLFDKLDWLVGPNDRIGVVGGNGSGKSTLLKILHGAESLDKGQIEAPEEHPCRIPAPGGAGVFRPHGIRRVPERLRRGRRSRTRD